MKLAALQASEAAGPAAPVVVALKADERIKLEPGGATDDLRGEVYNLTHNQLNGADQHV